MGGTDKFLNEGQSLDVHGPERTFVISRMYSIVQAAIGISESLLDNKQPAITADRIKQLYV